MRYLLANKPKEARGLLKQIEDYELLDEIPQRRFMQLMARIEQLKAILADRKVLLGVIRREILTVSEKYGDDRRTSIGFDEYDLSMEDLIPRENTVITMTKLG